MYYYNTTNNNNNDNNNNNKFNTYIAQNSLYVYDLVRFTISYISRNEIKKIGHHVREGATFHSNTP